VPPAPAFVTLVETAVVRHTRAGFAILGEPGGLGSAPAKDGLRHAVAELLATVTIVDDAILLIDTATGTVRPPTAKPGIPFRVVITPDNRTLYVLTASGPPGQGQVVPVEIATGVVGRPIAVGENAAETALSG
jgi:DNA-binding beta-propeller fold protein YncE